jgi:hypothetical protein
MLDWTIIQTTPAHLDGREFVSQKTTSPVSEQAVPVACRSALSGATRKPLAVIIPAPSQKPTEQSLSDAIRSFRFVPRKSRGFRSNCLIGRPVAAFEIGEICNDRVAAML